MSYSRLCWSSLCDLSHLLTWLVKQNHRVFWLWGLSEAMEKL